MTNFGWNVSPQLAANLVIKDVISRTDRRVDKGLHVSLLDQLLYMGTGGEERAANLTHHGSFSMGATTPSGRRRPSCPAPARHPAGRGAGRPPPGGRPGLRCTLGPKLSNAQNGCTSKLHAPLSNRPGTHPRRRPRKRRTRTGRASPRARCSRGTGCRAPAPRTSSAPAATVAAPKKFTV